MTVERKVTMPMKRGPAALELLVRELVLTLETAPDFRLVGLPAYDRWWKGPRQAALDAAKEGP